MRRIGALVFDGVELLDLTGPLQMFGMLSKRYSLHLVAEMPGPVQSGQGVTLEATHGFDAGPWDLLLVPGGQGTRREVENPALLNWLRAAAPRAELVMSVCTGSALLARAGLLQGRRATSNKMAFAWVESQGPDVEWVRQARWVEDGAVFTSSGVSAGMDMALAAIARLEGEDLAEKVALWCEYERQRAADADPFAARHGLV